MEVILDTNALSAIADGDEGIKSEIASVSRIFVPAIVLGEFRFGISASKYCIVYREWLEQFLKNATVICADDNTSKTYAQIRRELKQKGCPIPWHDIWIAANVIQCGYALLSRDHHFDYVEGVKRLSW